MKKICEFCHRLYTPNPKATNQKYCKRQNCKNDRRNQWQRNKRATDKDYDDNQERAYKNWAERHPNYWQQYRKKNPEYVMKNREDQKKRNEKKKILKKLPDFVKDEIAKMEYQNKKTTLNSGYYTLIPLSNTKIAKMERLIVKIDVFSIS